MGTVDELPHLPGRCRHCGAFHTGRGVCPRVKAIQYAADGVTPVRVEYHEPESVRQFHRDRPEFPSRGGDR